MKIKYKTKQPPFVIIIRYCRVKAYKLKSQPNKLSNYKNNKEWRKFMKNPNKVQKTHI